MITLVCLLTAGFKPRPRNKAMQEEAMSVLYETIARILREEDIEGLISIGASDDEYVSEAQEIYLALLNGVPPHTQVRILAICVNVWERFFNLGEDEMALRVPYLSKASQRILDDLASKDA